MLGVVGQWGIIISVLDASTGVHHHRCLHNHQQGKNLKLVIDSVLG
jgi:hypothetical protein